MCGGGVLLLILVLILESFLLGNHLPEEERLDSFFLFIILLLCFKSLSLTIVLVHLSHDMRFPTIRYVRPAKAKTSLPIRAV